MSYLIRFSVKNRKVTIILSIILMIAGILSYLNLPRQENPDVTSPSAVITTIYPGASAEEVEELITKKIETEISLLEGIESIESISSDNASIVIITINYSVDKDKQWDNLDKIINRIKPTLPEGAFMPTIDTESMVETAGMILALYGNDYSYENLSAYAEDLKKELINTEGIKKVAIEGSLQKQIYINIRTDLLNQMSLSIEDIHQLLLMQNIEIPSGSIDTHSGKIGVSIPGSFENLRDIENMVIDISESFGITRLKDIAEVTIGYDTESKKFEFNKVPAVLLTAYFKDNQNIMKTGKEIDAILNKATANMPESMHIKKITYQPDDVSASVNKFIINLFQGVFFVLLVVLIGMGWKNAAIVSTAMPFSILVTFIAMRLLQINIHQISVAALIISLGILVDNSIVVTDAIQHKIDEGYDPAEASSIGAIETSAPVFSSTLTTVAAFAPLVVLPGEAGEFAKSLPIVVIIALSVSYVSAMLLVPAITSIVLDKSKKSLVKNNYLKNIFKNALLKTLKHSVLTLILVFSFFIISVGVGLYFLPIEIFPYADKNYLYIETENEKKGDIDHTEQLVQKLYTLLEEEQSITSYIAAIGGYLPKFYLTVPPGTDAEHSAQILATFSLNESFPTNEAYAIFLDQKLNAQITGGKINVALPAITAPTADVEVILFGDEKNSLYEYAENLMSKISSLESIEKVENNIPRTAYKYELVIDDDLSTVVGLTKYDIQRQVNMALNGIKSSTLTTPTKEYEIYLQSDIKSITDLENLMIKSSLTGQKILLKQVSQMGLTLQTPLVYRYSRKPSVTIKAQVAQNYNVQSSQSHIEDLINDSLTEDGLVVNFKGEKETINKYLGGIAEAALYALAAIYIILLLQFKSSRQSLIILLTVPLSVIGSIAGLYLFRQPFSFTAGLGLASLIGIVVNNAILLLEHINHETREGETVTNACISSLDRRYRPIMLSTITTVIGLAPLAISGSSFFMPMAVTLMSGLSVSTFFTLLVIPTMFDRIFSGSKAHNV
ncbi:MAG: efflux RND transporter permease subunit [Tissierellales bacterium]|nr:efflux RND transporter permease subunit [Tissierellales bacterium]MBN2826959.1 efflux RND transporter permease subunit [Tissierellales bacterium]